MSNIEKSHHLKVRTTIPVIFCCLLRAPNSCAQPSEEEFLQKSPDTIPVDDFISRVITRSANDNPVNVVAICHVMLPSEISIESYTSPIMVTFTGCTPTGKRESGDRLG